MNSTQQGLLAEVASNPNEDAPRLVYADWLEEHGQADRAELIRAQLELAQLEEKNTSSQAVFSYLDVCDSKSLQCFDWQPIDPEIAKRVVLKSRIAKLIQKRGNAWLKAEGPKGCGISWSGFERGFVAAGRVWAAKKLAASGSVIARSVPVQTIEIRRDRANKMLSQAQALVDSGLLPRLNSLKVKRLSAEAFEIINRSPDVKRIERLACSVESLESVVRTKHWRGLKYLMVEPWRDRVPPELAAELFRARHLRGIKSLSLEIEGEPGVAATALAEAKFTKMNWLRMNLDDDSARLLAECPTMKSLQGLQIPPGRMTGTGASAILVSPYFKRLTVLSVSKNPVRRFTAKALATETSLRVLGLYSLHRGANLTGFASSPAMKNLNWLALTAAGSGRPIRQLARDTGIRQLVGLDLMWGHLKDPDLEALAGWPGLSELRCLHLHVNDFKQVGAEALANSDYLRKLRHLCVADVIIGRKGMNAVKKRFQSILRKTW